MIFKRILLLALFLSLGGCTSMSGLFGSRSDVNPDTTKAVEEAQPVESELPETELSEQALIAQTLLSRPDAFQSSKATLAPAVIDKISAILERYQSEDFEQSQKLMADLLQNELNLSSPVYVLAGDIEYALDNKPQAAVHYVKALQINEHNAKAGNRLARIKRQQGEFSEALAIYTKAITAQPAHAQSYRNRAVLYDLYLNEKARALADYEAYSALLHHQLHAQSDADIDATAVTMAEDELTRLKNDIKLVKRWLADVGRQVAAITQAKNTVAKNGN